MVRGQQTSPDVEVDLGPWAAYVVGHHPETLSRWQMDRRDREVYEKDPATGMGTTSAAVPRKFSELKHALKILGDKRCIESEFYKHLMKQEQTCQAVTDVLELEPDINCTDPFIWVPAWHDWLRMAKLAASMLPKDHEYRPWSTLGDTFGWILQHYGEEFEFVLGEEVETIKTLSEELSVSGAYPFMKEVLGLVGQIEVPVKGWSSEAELDDLYHRLYRRVQRLDGIILRGLWRRPPPQMLLLLDRKRLIFYEKEIDLSEIPEAQAVVLWVLAENVGKPVKLLDFEKQKDYPIDQDEVKVHLSRLRGTILRPAIRGYFARKGREPSRDVLKYCHIMASKKPRGSKERGYTLTIDEGQVRVVGDRPDWMYPATTDRR
jgi:hypothetical protein